MRTFFIMYLIDNVRFFITVLQHNYDDILFRKKNKCILS